MKNDSAMNAVHRHEVWVVVGLLLSLTVLILGTLLLNTKSAQAQERVISYATITVVDLPIIEVDIEEDFLRVENNSGVSFSMVGFNAKRDIKTPICVGCSKRQYAVDLSERTSRRSDLVSVQVMY